MKEWILTTEDDGSLLSLDFSDLPELVRCKNCKFRNDGCLQLEKNHYPDDDWFCADGIKKE